MGGTGGTLDPHNVGDRLTPLVFTFDFRLSDLRHEGAKQGADWRGDRDVIAKRASGRLQVQDHCARLILGAVTP